MVDVLLQTLPFFALIGLGYLAGRTGFFPDEATAWLTKFVFYFALSAMIFRFAANLSLGDLLTREFVLAYLSATVVVYLLVTGVALLRGRGLEEAAVEAQCGVIGNVGFLGLPMLAMLLGERAIGPVMVVLAIDVSVFGGLIVILITGRRDGRVSVRILGSVLKGLLTNPMIMSLIAGILWSSLSLPMPGPFADFLTILGAAATPGALFAIGASLASKSAERLAVAVWLSTSKLILHPAAVAFSALVLFPVEPYAAGVMIAAAALPVAGNVFILAQHYGVAPQRVSSSILISTAVSVVTFSAVIAWLSDLAGR
jgi:malonate transporter and related proteins